MARRETNDDQLTLLAEWVLPGEATLGSSVRAHGILLEARSKLPLKVRKSLSVVAGVLTLKMTEEQAAEFRKASEIVSKTMVDIEALPIIPREIEDILSITTTERHRWLKDGRLPSAGTRTVKLRGRARKITFHVFDPRQVVDILDRDAVSAWREDDAITRAENRRKAAWKAKLKRETDKRKRTFPEDGEERPKLVGWEDFERDGLLR